MLKLHFEWIKWSLNGKLYLNHYLLLHLKLPKYQARPRGMNSNGPQSLHIVCLRPDVQGHQRRAGPSSGQTL